MGPVGPRVGEGGAVLSVSAGAMRSFRLARHSAAQGPSSPGPATVTAHPATLTARTARPGLRRAVELVASGDGTVMTLMVGLPAFLLGASGVSNFSRGVFGCACASLPTGHRLGIPRSVPCKRHA